MLFTFYQLMQNDFETLLRREDGLQMRQKGYAGEHM